MIKLHKFFIAILCLLLAPLTQANATDPQSLLEDTSKVMLKALHDNTPAIRQDPQIAYDLIDQHLLPNIDFDLMSRWVLGKNWRKATVDQQNEFILQFRSLVTQFYTKALLDYLQTNDVDENLIVFQPFKGSDHDKYATVRSRITPPDGQPPVQVNYELRRNKADEWKVYDVSVEGVSLVTTYRSSFNQIVAKSGMDGLIDEVRRRIDNIDKEEADTAEATASSESATSTN